MRLVLSLVVFAILFGFGIAMPTSLALSGTVYDISINKVSHAIISFYRNGTLVSRVVSNDTGCYSVNLPLGQYEVIAYKPGTLLFSNESLLISSPNQTYDIILAPHINYADIPQNFTLPDLGYIKSSDDFFPNPGQTDYSLVLLFFLMLVALIGIALSWTRAYEPKDKDVSTILAILHEHNGKIKQQDLVKETGWSEAKVSLVLKSMKEKGIIKKKRIGREKIVILASESSDKGEPEMVS